MTKDGVCRVGHFADQCKTNGTCDADGNVINVGPRPRRKTARVQSVTNLQLQQAKAEIAELKAEAKSVKTGDDMAQEIAQIYELLPEMADTFADAWTDTHDEDEVKKMSSLRDKLASLKQ